MYRMFFFAMIISPISSMACRPPMGPETVPTATVMLLKDDFVEWEPVQFTVTITNQTQETIKVPISYPSLANNSQAAGEGLCFTVDKGLLNPKPDAQVQVFDNETPVVLVKPNERWSIALFIQSFFLAPKPGKYSLSYNLNLPFFGPDLAQGQLGKISVKGDLAFSVNPADAEKLGKALSIHAECLDHGDYWQRRGAIEAFSVVGDSSVVPYLVKMLKGHSDDALKALARFPKDEAAQAAVVKALQSPQFGTVVQALDVLTDWKYELPVVSVRLLINHGSKEVQKATLRYIKAMDKQEYRDELDKLIGRLDP